MTPSAGQVTLAVVVCTLAALAATGSLEAARRTRNWLYLVCAVGALGVVAGVVGQRVFPSEDAVQRLGRTVAERQVPGPWDAGVSIPGVGIRATPVAVGGALVAVAGLSLVLFFEPVPLEGVVVRPRARRRLEDDDAV